MTHEEIVEIVKSNYPRATAVSDYNWETCWTLIYDDYDEDGCGTGEIIGMGQFEGDAWANAARDIQKNRSKNVITDCRSM